MSLRLTRSRTAALAAGLVASASLVTISSATVDSASAACAPGVRVVKTKGKATGARVKTTRPVVAKVGRRYVARSMLTATTGRGSVTLTQTVCPDGTAGAAAQSTQSATARGMLTKSVTKKAATRKKAVKALKAAQKRAKKALAAKATRKSKKLAIAAAKGAAATKAHHALYDSTAYWIVVPSSSGTLTITTTQPAGAASFTAGPGGVPMAHVPAATATPTTAIPCLTKAPAWPTSFIASSSAISSPDFRAAADADDTTYGVYLVPVNVVNGSPNSGNGVTGSAWIHMYNGSSGNGVTETSTFQPTSGGTAPSTFAGNGLCLFPMGTPPGGGAVTFGGLAVSATFDTTSATVTGGVPVTLG